MIELEQQAEEKEHDSFDEFKEELLRVKRLEEPIYRFFSYFYLPPEVHQVSKMFQAVADVVLLSTDKNEERTMALRKLLEAKDCAVRAVIMKGPL